LITDEEEGDLVDTAFNDFWLENMENFKPSDVLEFDVPARST